MFTFISNIAQEIVTIYFLKNQFKCIETVKKCVKINFLRRIYLETNIQMELLDRERLLIDTNYFG